MDKIFEIALKMTLQFEGGYSNNPKDPGGETNKGIIKAIYDSYRKSKKLPFQSVKNITDDEVKEIYYNNYWLKASCDKIPDKVAVIHFDTAVNCGVGQANKFLQRCLRVVSDGVIGNKTIEEMKKVKDKIGLTEFVKNYLTMRKNYYTLISEKNTNLKVFLKGWNNRIALLETSVNQDTFYC